MFLRSSVTFMLGAGCALALLLCAPARADLPPDIGRGPQVERLPMPASKHWVWVNDFVFPHMNDGMALLIDGDTGRYLGTLSTGMSSAHVVLPRDGKFIYSAETYFSRGTRGTRTDVVTLYDAANLKDVAEIAIPAKRSSNLPMMANVALTDDDRFLLVYNFNPSQSVTVVDMKARKFVREVESPGCALVYPTGPRSFFSVCADGALLLFALDDSGAVHQRRSAALFDPMSDPVKEKAVRAGNTWYFSSYAGRIYAVEAMPKNALVRSTWWLTSDGERQAGWRSGGLQELAVDPTESRLYAIMHRGPVSTHKDPGKDIWVYDLRDGKRVRQFELRTAASAIAITRDPKPLLFALQMESTDLDVYEPATGKLLRSIGHVGTSPALLVTP